MPHLTPIAHQMMKTPIRPTRKTGGRPTFEWQKDASLAEDGGLYEIKFSRNSLLNDV